MAFNNDRMYREKPPCMGCDREWKMPGCHGACPDYGAWKAELERVKNNREAYASRSRPNRWQKHKPRKGAGNREQ